MSWAMLAMWCLAWSYLCGSSYLPPWSFTSSELGPLQRTLPTLELSPAMDSAPDLISLTTHEDMIVTMTLPGTLPLRDFREALPQTTMIGDSKRTASWHKWELSHQTQLWILTNQATGSIGKQFYGRFLK